MKAAAFSDSAWLAHWEREGPSLLARAWLSLYPHFSLSSVEAATGLTFLVTAATSKSGEMGDSGENAQEMGEIVEATGALHISDQSCDPQSTPPTNEPQLTPPTAKPQSTPPTEEPQLTPPSDNEIWRLWSELYNSHYWFWYQRWREQQQASWEYGEEGRCEGGGCDNEEMGDGDPGESGDTEGEGDSGDCEGTNEKQEVVDEGCGQWGNEGCGQEGSERRGSREGKEGGREGDEGGQERNEEEDRRLEKARPSFGRKWLSPERYRQNL